MATNDTVQYRAAELQPGETKEGLLAEAADLRRQIRHHEYQYYVLDDTIRPRGVPAGMWHRASRRCGTRFPC